MKAASGTPCFALVSLVLGAAILGAQSYSETERVTVIDLPVELQGDRVPKNLSAADFLILLDGETEPIVAYSDLTATDLRPYQALVYVDPELTDSRQLHESADLLLLATEDLMRLATVDLVMADPEPRFMVRDSSDAELFENALTGSSWDEVAGDGIRALRSGFLEAIAELEEVAEVRELANAFAREETRLVRQRLDLLLSFLAEGGTPGKLRVLLLVGLRFDLDPALFYNSWIDSEESSTVLAPDVQQLAASLAAYGWIVLPIAPPEPASPLVPGFRIGKWRISGPAGGGILGVQIVRESERDPELAEGYLENGEALLAQEKPAEARSAFKRALHHFYGDPRTADLQARALVGLSAAEKALGEDDVARTAMRLAAEVDPSVAEELGENVAVLLDPLAPLEVLAAESTGRILQDSDEMTTALASLGRRVRLTFQLTGRPTGETLPVVVRATRAGLSAASPGWVRFGTPETVAAARVRLLMGGDLVEPTHDLDACLARDQEQGDSLLLELRLETDGDALVEGLVAETSCRLTVGTGSFEERTRVIEHRRVGCRSTELGLSVSEEFSTDSEFVAVLLEHLPSGAWGVEVVEREDPF